MAFDSEVRLIGFRFDQFGFAFARWRLQVGGMFFFLFPSLPNFFFLRKLAA